MGSAWSPAWSGSKSGRGEPGRRVRRLLDLVEDVVTGLVEREELERRREELARVWACWIHWANWHHSRACTLFSL